MCVDKHCGPSSSIPLKKNHLAVYSKEIVITIYSSLLNRLETSDAVTDVCDLSKLPLTVKRIAANQEGSNVPPNF